MKSLRILTFTTLGLGLVCLSCIAAAQDAQDRECFNIRTISSWSALSERHIYVKATGAANHFLLTMFTRCPGIRFAQALASVAPITGAWIETGLRSGQWRLCSSRPSWVLKTDSAEGL